MKDNYSKEQWKALYERAKELREEIIKLEVEVACGINKQDWKKKYEGSNGLKELQFLCENEMLTANCRGKAEGFCDVCMEKRCEGGEIY